MAEPCSAWTHPARAAHYDERAVYVASGEIDIAGERFESGRLLVFLPGDRISILALSHARLMLVCSEPMDGPRHIWWNFVSSSKDRIAAARAGWKAKRFHPVPGDETEFIPLPDECSGSDICFPLQHGSEQMSDLKEH